MVAEDIQALETLKRRIAAEFSRRPRACITSEGMRVFWLSSQAGSLDRALDELVAEGQLRRLTLGGRAHYALAEAHGAPA